MSASMIGRAVLMPALGVVRSASALLEQVEVHVVVVPVGVEDLVVEHRGGGRLEEEAGAVLVDDGVALRRLAGDGQRQLAVALRLGGDAQAAALGAAVGSYQLADDVLRFLGQGEHVRSSRRDTREGR